ncbi:Neuronal acetylcholine receptor subunit alpha-10 [Hypsibius exemplaris]|uniref:Neuronal acetylcholine receptor subunit alpha-10 n=1 Tax=Hypsibius exemplaris TaxID=2072580 RepID=A0A9X6RKU0_HYPEX|nr:Neuronal acetylcholine receptor subunit alpha-10 [Hypsibius exemplaris]
METPIVGHMILILYVCCTVRAVEPFLNGRDNHDALSMEQSTGGETDEQRLYYHLMGNYDKSVRPVKEASTTVPVMLRITLTHIFDLDERNQVLTTMIWLNQEWRDELLTWDPADYGGLATLIIPSQNLWLPDIVLYNNADNYNKGYMQTRVMVYNDGKVYWPPPTKMRSTCKVDVRYFPFDTQQCLMKFGSGSYDGFQMDVQMFNGTGELADLKHYVKNGEWELQSITAERTVHYYDSGYPAHPFPHVTFKIIVRRKALYYVYNVIFPSVMMSILTLLVFVLPPESGEKIALGISVLLAFSVSMLQIAEKLPETSESVPLIGIYLMTVTAMASLSVMMTVTVITIDWRRPEKQHIPDWIKRLVLGQIAHVFGMYTDFNSCHRKDEEANEKVEPNFNARSDRNQWRQVARVMDRCLFWSFGMATLLVTVVLLVILPLIASGSGASFPVENTL